MNSTQQLSMSNKNLTLINGTLLGLGIYNLLYWMAKFFGLFQSFYNGIKDLWLLFILFELLAVASIFVDTVVRWDKFTHTEKRVRIALTALFSIAFVLRFIIGYMEALITGQVQ